MSVKEQLSTQGKHANATTTPEMRQFIQTSDLTVAKLSRLLNISEATVRKWQRRDGIDEGSNKPHKLNTTLTPVQEYVVVELRSVLRLSLDQLLDVTCEFINPAVSRSGLGRCLKRHGVSRLDDVDVTQDQDFEANKADFDQLVVEAADELHVSMHSINQQALAKALSLSGDEREPVVHVVSKIIPQAQTQSQTERQEDPSFVFIASDPGSRWVYVDIYQDGADAAAKRYMSYVLTKAPFRIRRVLANNYAVFKQNFRVLKETPLQVHVDGKENLVTRHSETDECCKQ